MFPIENQWINLTVWTSANESFVNLKAVEIVQKEILHALEQRDTFQWSISVYLYDKCRGRKINQSTSGEKAENFPNCIRRTKLHL